MNNIKLSIIIPHFNYHKGLERLLKSIPCIPEIQVIVVDDKSTKDIEEYEKLKQVFSNVSFYDNDGDKGAGNCRNIGISKALGEWIIFSDSDDFFLDGFYENVKEYFDKDYDLVLFYPTSLNLSTEKKGTRHKDAENLYKDYKEKKQIKYELRARLLSNQPHSKLIKRSLIMDNDIRFQNVRVSNDVMFSTMIGHKAAKVDACEKNIYCITEREGSLITQISEENYDLRNKVFIDKVKYIKANYPKQQFKMLQISGMYQIYLAYKYGFGIKKVFYMMRLFRNNGIPLLSIGRIIEVFLK